MPPFALTNSADAAATAQPYILTPDHGLPESDLPHIHTAPPLTKTTPLFGTTTPLLGKTTPLLGKTTPLLGKTKPLLGKTPQ